MKRIIDRKIYDTDTAQEVFSFSNGLGYTDFRNFAETLYLTERGTWFIAGHGGAMSSYAEPCGDGTGGGEAIRPMSDDAAADWLEEHDGTEALLEHFSGSLETA